MTKVSIYVITLFLLQVINSLFGQTQVQVIEKNIEKKIALSEGESFKISAEKANVKVTGWNKSYVQVHITFSAKHIDRSVAQQELEFIKYAISREDNIVELTNTFIIPGNINQLRSRLNVSYNINMPQGKEIEILNKYGNIDISGLKTNFSISADFCDISLNNVEGNIELKTSFSNIRGKYLTGKLFCTADKSQIDLLAIDGHCIFNASYGSIDISPGNFLNDITIDAKRVPVNIYIGTNNVYNYELEAKHGLIFIDDKFQQHINKTTNGTTFNLFINKNNPTIKILTNYSPITIKNK